MVAWRSCIVHLTVQRSQSRDGMQIFSARFVASTDIMPKIQTLRSKKPPAGWELLEDTLEDIMARMREVEREPHEGKRKCESAWGVLRLHHERSRYIYEMYFKKKLISRDLYDYCVRERWADAALIAKWRKPGYEHLCCLK